MSLQHKPECGTAYRGCAPGCPKDEHEKRIGEWIPDVKDDLSITNTEFHLLSQVATTERSGREIAQRYVEATKRGISYGRFYVTMRRLQERGLVLTHDTEDEDGLVRSFRITTSGAEAVTRVRERLAPKE